MDLSILDAKCPRLGLRLQAHGHLAMLLADLILCTPARSRKLFRRRLVLILAMTYVHLASRENAFWRYSSIKLSLTTSFVDLSCYLKSSRPPIQRCSLLYRAAQRLRVIVLLIETRLACGLVLCVGNCHSSLSGTRTMAISPISALVRTLRSSGIVRWVDLYWL